MSEHKIAEAIDMVLENGGYDGCHHKQWVLDQTLRILCGEGYDEVIQKYCEGEDGFDTYVWDEGIAP